MDVVDVFWWPSRTQLLGRCILHVRPAWTCNWTERDPRGTTAPLRYDIWCYAEDDNVYPQIPNGQKFTSGEAFGMRGDRIAFFAPVP